MRRLGFLLLFCLFPALTADGAVVLFGRTQVAIQTPFDNSTNGFTSIEVQSAIEEALALAIANDRFPLLVQYNGNANTGRYLEFFSGINSEDAPFFFNSETKVLTIVCGTTGTSSDAEIGFFNAAVSMVTPLYTLDMNNQKRKIDQGTPTVPLFTIPALGELSVRVTSSSINKPHCYMVFSSSI